MTATRKIPEHIRPYLKLLNNTGGNDPEELLERLEKEKHILSTNIVVGVLAMGVEFQVTLLERLFDEGLLKPIETKEIHHVHIEQD